MQESTLPTGKPYWRLDAFPLDASCKFDTLADALDYAQNNPIAYIGQILGVINSTTSDAYIIEPDKSLKPLGASAAGGGDWQPRVTALENELAGLSLLIQEYTDMIG